MMGVLPASVVPYLSALPPLPLKLDRMPAGGSTEVQTARTTGRMWALIDAAQGDERLAAAVREAVGPAVSGLPSRERAVRVWRWVKQRVRFRLDPDDDELIRDPRLMLAMSQPEGDCDDFSVLAGAMLKRAGVPFDLVTVAADREDPRRFSHVYLLAHVEGGDLPLDASHGEWPGWEAEQHGPVWRKAAWPDLRAGLTAPARGLHGGVGMRGLGQEDIWGGGAPTTVTTPTQASWTSVFKQLIPQAVTTAGQILTSRYGQPPAGTYIQTKEGVIYRQPTAAGALTFPTFAVGGTSELFTWILIAGGVILGAVVISKAVK